MTQLVRAAGPSQSLSTGPSEDTSIMLRGCAVSSWIPPQLGKMCSLNQGTGARGRRAARQQCSQGLYQGFGCAAQLSPASVGRGLTCQAIEKTASERGLIQESSQPRSDIWSVRKDHRSSPSIMQKGDGGPGRSSILPEETE